MTASVEELMGIIEDRAFVIYAMKCDRGKTDANENSRLIGWCMAAAYAFTVIALQEFRSDESYLQSIKQMVEGENDEDNVAGN